MYSYSAATLAMRAKCSLSFYYYLSLPNDQPFCCHRPCCHFSVTPRILSAHHLPGFSSPFPSKSLFPAGRRRLRVFLRTRCSDIIRLLAEPEETFQIESIHEVRKYADDSRNDESAKRNGGFRRYAEEKVGRRDKSGRQVNVWDGRSEKVARVSDVERASVSANVREIEKGGSSASAARQNNGMDHRGAGRDRQRKRLEKHSEVTEFRCSDVQSAAYHPRRDFEETGIRGRGERAYLERNSAQVSRDKRIHIDGRALEQDESRRSSTQRLNKSVMGMDVNPNLVQDSSQVCRNKRSQMEMELQLSAENRSEEREEKLAMSGNSIELRGGERKHIDRGAVEGARRKTQMLGEVSEVHSGNVEAFSLPREKRGMELGSYFVQSSIPATKDKGTQVEMDDACYDQIEMSRFNSNNIVNATSSWGPPVSRVDPQEYGALLGSNQVSSMRKQNDQANRQAYLLYDARVQSERDATEFDLTRSKNRRISNSQETYNSRIENQKEFSSTESSSLVLTREEEIRRSSLTGESSQSAPMEMTSTGNLHGISSSQPTYTELNYDAGFIGYQKNPTRIKNRYETSSTVSTQERKERHSSSLLVGESSQYKTMQTASTGSLGDVSSSVKTYSEVDHHSGRDVIHHVTNDAIESAKRLDKSSAFHVDEFFHEIQQEMMSPNESGKEPNVSTIFQIEETGRRESQTTAGMQLGELTGSRGYGDGRHIKEGGRLSASGSQMRGPSDEMWGTSNAEEPEENSPTLGSMEDRTTPTPTLETSITRSPKSLWSYVADIIRMSWILRGHSTNSTLKSYKRDSSNESLSSEAWFSGGPEPDEDGAGDETQNTEKTGLLKESGPLKESVKLPFEESKRGNRLTGIEQNSSISSGFMTSGLSARTASSSVEVEDSKASQDALSSVASVEQQLASKSDVALPSTTDIVESRVRDKVKVLKQSSSYPVGVRRVGFTSIITQATGAEQMEAAQVGQVSNSSMEIFEQPSVSTVDSALPRITYIEEVDRPGSIPKLELDPFGEKLPEVGGTEEAGIKRRKFQRNKQVLSEQFDEWEEAFKKENEQKKLDELFMREAILEAKKGADTWEVPVGAVLVQNGKIIARGCNMVEELRDSTAHAEMICIREASNLLRTWRLAETTLYVTLEPCPMCAGAILQARIDTVVWGAPNRLLGADGSWVRLFPGGDEGSSNMNPPSQMVGPVHPFHPKIAIRRGVLETECGDVMQQFFKLRRKKDKKPESSPPPSCLPISNRPTKFFSKLHNIFGMMFCL